jgi:hypothetical protein
MDREMGKSTGVFVNKNYLSSLLLFPGMKKRKENA